jgi:crotonobetainyl-CoA:carnitine CoA-transferase CaiB-like acyl-CoA transferase
MAHDLALADIKILDFTWVMAGPAATRVLADYGATVVRIESTRRLDTGRTIGPFHDGQPGVEHSGFFHNVNAGKLGLTLDLSQAAGRDVARDLVRWADVVTESFSPHVMHAWELDYAALRQVKPDIIMISTCLMGQSGPYAQFAGFGNLAAAISGFFSLTGWPDRPPAGPFGAYTDYVAPRFTAVAILAALEYRRRTGQGQYIDQSQAESALHFLTPALLDYTVHSRSQERVGNADAHLAPHGVYPTAGQDRWLALAVRTDAQWQALCEVMRRPDLGHDPRFATLAARLTHREALDTIVAVWTHEHSAQEAEAMLQARGIPASAVQNSQELYRDPQLLHRGHFVQLPEPLHGTTTVEASRFRLSRTPAHIERAGPTLGRDNQYVLETILGYSPERIAALADAGILQ